MKNTFKILFFALTMTFSVSSCLEDKPLENDKPIGAQSLQNMRQAFIKATDGATPLIMGKDEFAVFRISAKLYTGDFQGLGYKSAQVLDASNSTTVIEVDGANKTFNTRNLKVLLTDYKEPVDDQTPPEIELQKEWSCTFLKPPYYIWWDNDICPLPPEQNYWVFAGLSEPETSIFYNLKMTRGKQKLPKKLIDENRCYGFENCEINVVYMEYDMFGKDSNGMDKRIHYVSTFSGDLPYLASNIKNCYSTLLDVGNDVHPGEICQELVDFQPGAPSPEYCPDNNFDQPCAE